MRIWRSVQPTSRMHTIKKHNRGITIPFPCVPDHSALPPVRSSPFHPATRACPTKFRRYPCGLTAPPCRPCVPGHSAPLPVRPRRSALPPVRAQPPTAALSFPSAMSFASPAIIRRDRPRANPAQTAQKNTAFSLFEQHKRRGLPDAALPCLNRGLNGFRGFRGLPHTSPPPLYRSHPLCSSHALPPSVVGTGPRACPYFCRHRSHRHFNGNYIQSGRDLMFKKNIDNMILDI